MCLFMLFVFIYAICVHLCLFGRDLARRPMYAFRLNRVHSGFHWLFWYDPHGLAHHAVRLYLLCCKSCQINITKPHFVYFLVSAGPKHAHYYYKYINTNSIRALR